MKRKALLNMDKDEKILQKRLLDLGNRSFSQNMYTFSDFLSLADQTVLWGMKEELRFVAFRVFGGNSECERVMVRFGSVDDLGYEEEYPISCLEIKPFVEKFADQLTHRDFLGALMNLGMKREVIGDIFVQNKSAYLYCHKNMVEYIIENLDKVKHTHIKCVEVQDMGNCIVKEKIKKEVTVSSDRVDTIIAKVYNMSRTKSLELFRGKCIFINGRVLENNSYSLKKEDVISVRGHGKFTYEGIFYETKKGKICVQVGIYV